MPWWLIKSCRLSYLFRAMRKRYNIDVYQYYNSLICVYITSKRKAYFQLYPQSLHDGVEKMIQIYSMQVVFVLPARFAKSYEQLVSLCRLDSDMHTAIAEQFCLWLKDPPVLI